MIQNPFSFLLLLLLTFPAATICATLPPDAVSLLSFKSNADLDNKLLYTTNERFDYCQWQGVKCAQGRVVRYAVQSFGLRGSVSAATLTRLDQLRVLSLRNNSLFGPLPDFSPLINLKTLFLDQNHFSSEFPPSLLSLHRLLILDLSRNNLTSSLPEALTLLARLTYLRLDSNRFSGTVPPLNQTTLVVFNLSNNNLSGPIPVTPTLKKFRIFSFMENPSLCGEVIHKPCRDYPFFNSSSGGGDSAAPSPSSPLLQNAQSQQGLSDTTSQPSQKKHHKKVGLILGFVIGILILTAAILSLVALIRKRKEEREEREVIPEKIETDYNDETKRDTPFLSLQSENANPQNVETKRMKYQQQIRVVKSGSLVFCSGEEELYTLELLMRASAELLGRGTIGTTYKAVMANQLIVSVKRLDASKTAATSGEAFEQHMETVGVLRHPNLVPVRAYFQAQQERLVIFDYQPNGSLFNLIHGSRSTRSNKPLHWTSCLKIAEDVAQGLAYIHQASKFVHGNLKSSNVLLGSDFEACITDYCLAMLADTSSDEDPDFSSYRAPEIRKCSRRATPKSDVYAFGVLLLELLSGKPPSQHPYLAPPDVPDWIHAMRDDDSEDDMRLRMLVEVASICSMTSPEQRPTMWQVLKMITNIKEIMDDSSRDLVN